MSLEKIGVFRDTKSYFKQEPFASAIRKSKKENVIVHTPIQLAQLGILKKRGVPARIIISKKGTLQAAKPYAKDKRVAVLNFASYTQPGGAVELGASTQEESLCRCSTLFGVINSKYMHEKFYGHSVRYLTEAMDLFQCEVAQKARDYTCAISYAPDILVFKEDGHGNPQLAKPDHYYVDVITSAAPRIPRTKQKKFSERDRQKYFNLYCERAEMIIEAAARKNADVLILGAYGCGAFNNPPELVARAFAQITQKYRDYFDLIEYGVYPGTHPQNYEIFKNVLLEQFDDLVVK